MPPTSDFHLEGRGAAYEIAGGKKRVHSHSLKAIHEHNALLGCIPGHEYFLSCLIKAMECKGRKNTGGYLQNAAGNEVWAHGTHRKHSSLRGEEDGG